MVLIRDYKTHFNLHENNIIIDNFNPNKLNKLPFNKKIESFSHLPYKKIPFNSRNWGHKLHNLCSYQSRLKASIAYNLVMYFSSPGHKILDPFSGVGTIPLESCLNGRIGVGLDINPIAYNVTLAKTRLPSQDAVWNRLTELQEYLKYSSCSDTSDDFIKRFYHPQTLNEIIQARDFFLNNNQPQHKDPALSFLLACMLHILHGNRPYALSRRSHNLTPLAPSGPLIYKSVIEKLKEKIKNVYNSIIPTNYVNGDAEIGSVLEIPFQDNHFDAILTSPPFWSSTRFYANNRIRLWFCGWDYCMQEKNGRSIFLDELQRQNLSIYKEVFSETSRVLKNGGTCIFHLGVVKGKDIGKEIEKYAETSNFRVLDFIYEATDNIEHHGMSDQGVTKIQQFMIMKKK